MAIECDNYETAVMNLVEYKKQKSCGLSAVKCHLICAFYFFKLHLRSVLIDMQYIPVCVIGN